METRELRQAQARLGALSRWSPDSPEVATARREMQLIHATLDIGRILGRLGPVTTEELDRLHRALGGEDK